MRKTKTPPYRLLIFSVAAIIFIALSVFMISKTYSFLKRIGIRNTNQTKKVEKHTFTTVLLGYGGGAHEGTYLTDTMILIHVNYESKKAVLISLPRDIWVKLPTKSGEPFAAKINGVYQLQLFPATYPDVNVKKYTQNNDNGLLNHVLKQITGLDVDSYVAVDFKSFVKIIDLLGGIDVDVQKSFTDTQYPVDGKETDLCGKTEEEFMELEKFVAGVTHMDGETALKYARSRHSPTDGGDFNRARRQQQVIEATKNKLLSPFLLPKIPSLMSKLENDIKTNTEYTSITKLSKEMLSAKEYQVSKIVLSDDNFLQSSYSQDGQFILIPKAGIFNWTKLRQRIIKLSNNPTPTPAESR
jgi:LCP family protein required for cell wall assembly